MAICVDPVDQNRELSEQLGLGFPILSDPEGVALRAFDVLHAGAGPRGSDIARPATFIAANGVIHWRDLTGNYRVRPRPATLLRVLHSLGSGSSTAAP